MKIFISSSGYSHQVLTELNSYKDDSLYDQIVLHNDDIFFYPSDTYIIGSYNRLISVADMVNYLNTANSKKWRNFKLKESKINYMDSVLKKMISYKREVKINNVLNPLKGDCLFLAC